jgi:tRNA-specific 2-thiouridylase
VGRHEGDGGFTVGQRRGLGGGSAEPLYVLEIRPEAREVVVGAREELLRDVVRVAELNWLEAPPAEGDVVQVQLRYRARPVRATVEWGEGDLRLVLSEPTPAITPGQSAVVFDGPWLRGGGRIASAARAVEVA